MKIYLAGQITDNKDAKRQFQEAAAALSMQGHDVFNPYAFGENNPQLNEIQIMIKEIEILSSCQLLLLLPNYKNSKGTKIEIAWAIKFNIKIALYDNNTISPYALIDDANKKAERFIQLLCKDRKINYDIFTSHSTGSRQMPFPFYRYAIAYILENDGYSKKEISQLLKRDRTSIIYYIEQATFLNKTHRAFKHLLSYCEGFYNHFNDNYNAA